MSLANDLSERKAAARRNQRTKDNRTNLQAILGDANRVVPDPDLPGNVLIQQVSSNGLLDRRSVRAPTKYMPMVPGTPVKLKRDYMGRLQVDEIDPDVMLAMGTDTVGQQIANGSSSTQQANFETFRCVPSEPPSTVVNVKAANFIWNGIIYPFGGASIDLGAGGANVIPASGNMARIIVALMSDFLTLEAVSSTPRGMTDVPLGTADTQEALNALAVDSVASWYMDLEDAQTAITVADVTPAGDLRNMINLSDWVPVPAAASDPGIKGQMAFESGWLYVCVATNTWERTTLSSW